MNQQIEGRHDSDLEGNPAGGLTTGTGIRILWQNGPLGRGAERKEPNGAFVEGVIAAAVDRIEYYQEAQGGKFECGENIEALMHLKSALRMLELRTARREDRGVEGTHTA